MRHPWILASVILTGCATYQAKPLDPAQLARHFEERSLASDELRAYLEQQLVHPLPPWPLQRWDRQLLTLAAFYYSPTLKIARSQWQGANADVALAGEHPNPSLQFPFDYTTNHHGPGRPYTTGPMLDIPIETAHKRDYRIAQASRLSEVARFNFRGEAWRVRSRIRVLMLDLYAAQQRSSLLQQQIAAQRDIVEMMKKRNAVGVAAAPDVYQVSLALIDAQTALTAEQNRLQTLRGELASAVGVPVATLASVQLDLAEFGCAVARPPSAAVQRAALFHRADLRAALARYAASQSALQLEIAKQYPDIHIGPGYTYDVGANKISFGLAAITLPVFNQNQGAIAQAEARRMEEAARTEALQDTIINDLEQARARYVAGLSAERTAAARLATAQQQVESQIASFKAGNTDRLALIQARIVYQASALAQLDAAVVARQAAGALEDAMQMPLSTDAPSLPQQPDGVLQ